MADLHILGDWHGPGEERAARRLAADLPDDWDVLAGRQIPDPMGPVDLDLVVVGRNGVYVCEEKAWGRHVVAGEVASYVNGAKRHSPANQVAHATRVLASMLRAKVDGWVQGQRRLPRDLRPVSGHVVLSHPSLILEEADELGADAVLRLGERVSGGAVCCSPWIFGTLPVGSGSGSRPPRHRSLARFLQVTAVNDLFGTYKAQHTRSAGQDAASSSRAHRISTRNLSSPQPSPNFPHRLIHSHTSRLRPHSANASAPLRVVADESANTASFRKK